MNEKQIILIGALIVFFIAFLVIVNILDNHSINGIKAKTVGDGQHGTARWATRAEIKKTFSFLPFEPEKWRKGENLPTVQGTIIGCRGGKNTTAIWTIVNKVDRKKVKKVLQIEREIKGH